MIQTPKYFFCGKDKNKTSSYVDKYCEMLYIFQQNTKKLCKTPGKYMFVSYHHKIKQKTGNCNNFEGRLRKLNQSKKPQNWEEVNN